MNISTSAIITGVVLLIWFVLTLADVLIRRKREEQLKKQDTDYGGQDNDRRNNGSHYGY